MKPSVMSDQRTIGSVVMQGNDAFVALGWAIRSLSTIPLVSSSARTTGALRPVDTVMAERSASRRRPVICP